MNKLFDTQTDPFMVKRSIENPNHEHIYNKALNPKVSDAVIKFIDDIGDNIIDKMNNHIYPVWLKSPVMINNIIRNT